MTSDEQFLTELYQSLDQEEIGPSDPRYVPVDKHREAFGPDAVSVLCRAVERAGRGNMTFLTGTRGSGKSTQVLRLGEELSARGFAVAYVPLDDYLNLHRPLELAEVLYAMVGAVSDHAASFIPLEDAIAIGWGRMGKWLSRHARRVDLTPEASLGSGIDIPGAVQANAVIKAQMRQDDSFVGEMNRIMRGRIGELVAEANAAVDELVKRIQASWREGEWRGLVVMFDGIDHVRGTDFEDVRRALQQLFDVHSRSLNLQSVRTIFVVPQWLVVTGPTVRQVFNVRVHSETGETFEPGIEALCEIVRHRIPEHDVERLFGSPDQLRNLAAASGGHLRDLLRLVREASVMAEELPFSDAVLGEARQSVRDTLLPLAEDQISALRHVAESKELPLPTQSHWEPLAGLFDRHLVLTYRNGETWFDIHPLIRDVVVRDGG